jgi:EmrB/QacA subfamily drug resistance transporter
MSDIASPTATRPTPSSDDRDTRWLALVVIAVAQLMVALDATIVNIALPSAQAALGFGDADRTWVVTAYTSMFAGLLLLGGRVADRFGRRRAFLGGLIGFAAASALAGLAPSFGVLVAGRALQGAFAAVLTPTALSLVATTFTDGRERAKAFGVYGAVASSGAAVGLLLGGVLTEYTGWRWCLFVNVLVALGAWFAGRAFLPRDDGHPQARLDIISGVLVTAGLAAIVLGASQAAAHGWGSAPVLAPVGLGVALVVAFLIRQRRVQSPLLPLWVLADRSRAGAYLAVAVAVVGSFGMFLMLTYHFQVVLGWSPVQAGLAFLPLSLAVSASAYGLGSRLLPTVAPRLLIAAGLVPAAAGLGLLTMLSPTSGYAAIILPAELLLGLGMGLVFTPAISVATSGVDPRHAGVAAATANTATQVGGSVGTAILNSVAVAATASYAAAHPAGDPRTALVHGYATATGWSAIVAAATAILVVILIRVPRPEPRPQPADALPAPPSQMEEK